MISILDYGAGNLRSVENTLEAIGVEFERVRDDCGLRQASKLILPGVGHFGQMMRALDQMNVRGILIERIQAGIPFLGICLGLQALFEASDEAPEVRGLGIFPGCVKKFSGDLRVPHMGWDSLERTKESPLLKDTGDRPFVYFANSFYAPPVAEATAVCDYGVRFAAVIDTGNTHAVQFHPEKSGAAGLRVMSNFVCS